MKKELRKCDKNESSKKSYIHAHETQPFKRKWKKNILFCIHVQSKNVLQLNVRHYDMYNYSLFYVN